MTIDRILSDLNLEVELARDIARKATKSLKDARDLYAAVEHFNDNTSPHDGDDIGFINKGDTCSILTRHYHLDGRNVLFTITQTMDWDDDAMLFIGHIIDYAERTVLYACRFYHHNFEREQDLFDRFLVNYVEWRFEIR